MPSKLKNNKQPCCVRWRLKWRSSLFGLQKSIYQATSSLYAVPCSSAAMEVNRRAHIRVEPAVSTLA